MSLDLLAEADVRYLRHIEFFYNTEIAEMRADVNALIALENRG